MRHNLVPYFGKFETQKRKGARTRKFTNAVPSYARKLHFYAGESEAFSLDELPPLFHFCFLVTQKTIPGQG